MASHDRSRKAKTAKILSVASLLIMLLTYLAKEILRDNLKEFHDSLVSAEAQYRTESDQSAISQQIMNLQQQIELVKLGTGGKDPHRDFSTLIAQDIPQSMQAKTNLDASFDSVSRLIDKFPSGANDVRSLREKVRQQIQPIDNQIADMLKPSADHDVRRFVQVKLAMMLALTEQIGVVVLGDATLTAAHRVEDATEKLIRICTGVIYGLFFLGLALALYAALTGVKMEVAE
jgi:hypothetical protein